jgi:four helix bundle protein
LPAWFLVSKPWDLRERTLQFAVDVIQFCRTLPTTDESKETARQLRRASSSVGAHYAAAQRSKSDADYIAKLSGGIEEADESTFWFDLLIRSNMASEQAAAPLRTEADELARILLSCRSTAIGRRERVKASRGKTKSPL